MYNLTDRIYRSEPIHIPTYTTRAGIRYSSRNNTRFSPHSTTHYYHRDSRNNNDLSTASAKKVTRYKPNKYSQPIEFVFEDIDEEDDDDITDREYIDRFNADKHKYDDSVKKFTQSYNPYPKRRNYNNRKFDRYAHVTAQPRPIPVISYGIILYTIEQGVPYFLLAQRRDTIAYVDFLRGNYQNDAETYISLMTPEERIRLISYSFDQLWMDLWLNHNCRFYKQEYRKAMNSYNNIIHNLKQLIDNVQLSKDSPDEPQWGFPKGKKHMRETEIDAAIREFEEETKLDFSQVSIKSTVPVTEVFQGFNSKLYKTVYFIAEAHNKLPIRYIQSDNPVRRLTISEEIGKMDWFGLVDSKNHLNFRRQDLLNKAYLRIKKQDWRNDPIEISTPPEDNYSNGQSQAL